MQYSLGIPPAQINRVGRLRTTSQTYVAAVTSTTTNTTVTTTPSLQSPSHTFSEPSPVAVTPQSTISAELPRVSSPTESATQLIVAPIPVQPIAQTTVTTTPSLTTPITTPIIVAIPANLQTQPPQPATLTPTPNVEEKVSFHAQNCKEIFFC